MENNMNINISGRGYAGQNVSIINGVVTVDGVVQDQKVSGVVEIRILEGSPINITTDASVNCGDVKGEVSAGGSVNCDDVGGNVSAGGSVNCDVVGGNVRAGGSVRHG
jgi:hypothetical protein